MNIRSTYKYKTCDDICRAIALLRARTRCEICPNKENRPIERHHIFFGRYAAYWQLRLNHNFQIILCSYCHHNAPYAPHRHEENNKAFITKMSARLRETDPERLVVIDQARHTINQLNNSRPPLDVLHKALKEEYERIESTSWMDMESQVPPGRLI